VKADIIHVACVRNDYTSRDMIFLGFISQHSRVYSLWNQYNQSSPGVQICKPEYEPPARRRAVNKIDRLNAPSHSTDQRLQITSRDAPGPRQDLTRGRFPGMYDP
jgi:hypothetical protein